MLLDSSGLLAYVDASDAAHQDAVTFFSSADVLLTHSYILAELVPLFQSRGIARSRSLEFQSQLMDSPEVRLEWVDRGLHDAALTFSIVATKAAVALGGHGDVHLFIWIGLRLRARGYEYRTCIKEPDSFAANQIDSRSADDRSKGVKACAIHRIACG